ncbi:abc transporter b family member 29 [Quercus suber]|uniref:Abc transporter b family member 29 n=1 Tax=Quercus suber TaxID=58331 RepID=A0AAW0M6H4_QUESU
MSLFLLNPPSPPPSKLLKLKHRHKHKQNHCPFSTPPIPPLLPPKNSSTFKPLNSTQQQLPSDPTPEKPNPSLSKTLNSLKPYLLSQRRPIFFGWLCSLVSVFSLSKLVPKLSQFSSTVTATTTATTALKLRDQGLVLGALLLVRFVASYWQQAFLWDAALNAGFRIRLHVFDRVLQRDLAFFESSGAVSSGDIAYRVTAEAADTIVPSTLQLSAMAAQMLMISPALSLISAMVIPCMALTIAYLGEKLRKISKRAQLSIASLSAYLNEALPAILFVKASNSEPCESARFQRLAHTDLCEHLKKKKMKAFIPQMTQIIYFGALFILCVGSLVVSSGSFDGCSMVSFVMSLVFLVEPIQGVGKAYNELKQGEPAIERLFELMRFKSKVIEKSDAIDLYNIIGEIWGKYALCFEWIESPCPSWRDHSSCWPSGGGKTTLVKLLLRLYDPLSGCILIDNHNIQDIRLDSLRRHVSLVPQDIGIRTVAENIGYKDLLSKIDMDSVEHAAQTANADEFIRKLPEGLALARALYQNSSILILDEATSALDSRSELLVRQAMERIMENHTVLVIAHRMETVLMAKRVFLLDDGKLEELNRSTLLGGSHHDKVLSTGLEMDTSNPSVFVNAELLRLYVGRRVRAVIQVLRSDGGVVTGKSTDENQIIVKGSPPVPLSNFVETHIHTISFVNLQMGNLNICSFEMDGAYSVMQLETASYLMAT